MGLKQWTNAVIGVIDKKLERFDPKWQAANGKGGLRSRYEDKTGIARHREWRGVKDMNSKMINSVMRGAFLKNSDLRKEFLDLLPLNKN